MQMEHCCIMKGYKMLLFLVCLEEKQPEKLQLGRKLDPHPFKFTDLFIFLYQCYMPPWTFSCWQYSSINSRLLRIFFYVAGVFGFFNSCQLIFLLLLQLFLEIQKKSFNWGSQPGLCTWKLSWQTCAYVTWDQPLSPALFQRSTLKPGFLRLSLQTLSRSI